MTQSEPTRDTQAPDPNEHEELEWRELQNAQIVTMMHVWDNPEDECWNDIPLDGPIAPTPTSAPYPEPYPYFTDDQHDLYDRMRQISEEGFCAGWIFDNEYNIWNAITLSQPAPGYGVINPRLLRRCKKLSDEIGGWIYWTQDGPKFAPMAQWLAMVEARRNAGRSPATVR